MLGGPEDVFRVTPVKGPADIHAGSLVNFQYTLADHDPSPLVMVTHLFTGSDGRHRVLQGVNIHYLPLNVTMTMIQKWADSPSFKWDGLIENYPVLRRATRRYNSQAILNPVVVDWKGFMTRIALIRTLDPITRNSLVNEVERQLAINRVAPDKVKALIDNQMKRFNSVMTGPPPSISTKTSVGTPRAGGEG